MTYCKRRFLAGLLCIFMVGCLAGCRKKEADEKKQDINEMEEMPKLNEEDMEALFEEEEAAGEESEKEEGAGNLQIGDVVNREEILDYVEQGDEYTEVYAVKRGEEFEVIFCGGEDESPWWGASSMGEHSNMLLSSKVEIVPLSVSSGDELVGFGDATTADFIGVTDQYLAAPFIIEKGAYAGGKTYWNAWLNPVTCIAGLENLENLNGGINIAEVDGVSIEDPTVQKRLEHCYTSGATGRESYIIVGDEDITVGWYEQNTFKEASFRPSVVMHTEGDGLWPDTAPTKDGYTVISDGESLKNLGGYETYWSYDYGLVRITE